MAQQMNKQKQKNLLTEIMNDDAKDGLYDTTQTAVEWLVEQEVSIDLGGGIRMKVPISQDVIEQAKQMEKEQRNNLILEIDCELANLENYLYGDEGKAVTQLRYKLISLKQ